MATIVHQGFQSYFESQQFETRALTLKLSSPNNPYLSTPLISHFLDSSFTPQDNTTTTNASTLLSSSNLNSGSSSGSVSNSKSWSFLESLSNSSSNDKEENTLSSYVQPPSSFRTLNDESLALCTESLGSESGSDTIQEDQDLFSVSYELQNMQITRMSSLSRQGKKRKVIASLPPPLTSMRGFKCIQVKSHRENGRLVMMATTTSSPNRCLQDRSNGCVRLAILIDSDENIESETKEEEEETMYIEKDNKEHIQEHEDEEEVERVQRSRRCIEGDRENRGFPNWESLCVATS